MREIRTSGLMSGEGKRGGAVRQCSRLSSTLPMNPDGTGLARLTHTVSYDGGPVFSRDRKWIAYRGRHPREPQELAEYKSLLSRELVRPMLMDLWIMRADGSGQRQVTHLEGASFAPYFFSDGKRLIFASNYENPGSSQFELYAVDLEGRNLERITFADGFTTFPMCSFDGKKLVFASNRNGKLPHEINIFVADWVP